VTPLAPLIMIFCCCVVVFAISIFIYEKRDTPNSAMIVEMKRLQMEVKRIDELVSGNTSTVIKVRTDVDHFLRSSEGRFKACDDALQVFRDQVSETREKQIQLKSELSSKRPIVKFPQGAIQLEIIQTTPTKKPLGKGVNSLIREGTTK
jgi:hypothetical protein